MPRKKMDAVDLIIDPPMDGVVMPGIDTSNLYSRPGRFIAVNGPAWPDPDAMSHVYDRVGYDSHRYGKTPEGVFPGVTTALKVLGLGKEGLIKWATNLEREACLAAVGEAYREELFSQPGHFITPESMVAAVERRLGKERASVKALEKAADIGSQVHNRIRWFLARECGQDAGQCPPMSDAASRAYVSFTDWWARAGLTPVRCEQPIWDPEIGYSGTADLIAKFQDGVLGVVDFKSGKGIYLEYHLQVMAYVKAAQRWDPGVQRGLIVRLPKTEGEVFDESRDVEPLGTWRYGNREMSRDELWAAFRSALMCWTLLCRNPKFNQEVMS